MGLDWTLEFWSDLVDDEGDQVEGLCLPETNTIKINSNYPANRQRSTYLHERIHASLAVSGLSELLDGKLEEAIVVCIENGIFPIVEVDKIPGLIFRKSKSRK